MGMKHAVPMLIMFLSAFFLSGFSPYFSASSAISAVQKAIGRPAICLVYFFDSGRLENLPYD